MSDKELIQSEFGQNAESYLDSKTHRMGASLDRLLELLPPQSDWKVLDVATAVGYTAYAFAPHVEHVWATDITDEMLDLARREADHRHLKNVTVEYAEAQQLPYDAAAFDLVTCRIAAHHFANIDQFLQEAARVLRPNGMLAVVDNVVPDESVGDYVNAFEKLRDPSHGRCLSMDEWETGFTNAGFTVTEQETLDKEVEFTFWAKRHDANTQRYLRSLLMQAPQPAAEFLQPSTEDGRITFHLREGITIGQKA